MNWYSLYRQSNISLGQQLMNLRPQLAAAAQQVYNEWAQDESGYDEVLGEGGICQDIASAMADVISQNIPDAEVRTVDAQVGEQHVWCIAYRNYGDAENFEGYHVDIPPGVYETGGGYSWKKIPNVLFDANDVLIIRARPDEISTEGY